MSQAVKRACDACHRRKVKCDGVNPCRNCTLATLTCTFNAVPQKKGPKGSRAKVISELRDNQRQTSLVSKIYNRQNGLPTPVEPAGGGPSPAMVSIELAKYCLDYYFNYLYEKAPILDRQSVETELHGLEQNRDFYCMLTSLCAFVMLQPGATLPATEPFALDLISSMGTNLIASQLLVDECVRVRKGLDYLDNPTLNTLATDFFLYGCYHSMEAHDKAWYYLREATTMMHMAGMNKETTYRQWNTVESSRRRRAYWLFFVLERAHALLRQRPVSLQATIQLPAPQDDTTDPFGSQVESFARLVRLYQAFDEPTIAAWNKVHSYVPSQHVANLQKQLSQLAETVYYNGQLSDLNTNQQWLKGLQWTLNNGRSESHNAGSDFDWQVPQGQVRELLTKMASQFPVNTMEVFNSGLIEKLIDICSTAMEYMPTLPASRDPFSLGPREHLGQVLQIVGLLRNNHNEFLPMLLTRIHQALPRLADPKLNNTPDGCSMANIDIFDGFGNAGMAQPPQMQMQMDTDFDRKFSLAEYDKIADMSSMSGPGSDTSGSNGHHIPTTTAASDMNSPFPQVSSPSVMSPGMEFPQDMNSFCSPMHEMVSPMGQQHQNQQHQHPHHLMHNQYMQANMGQHQQQQAQQPQHHNEAMGSFDATPCTPSHMSMNTASMPTAQSMSQQGMNGGGQNGMMNHMSRQGPPQRTNSFAVPQHQQRQIQTVGDFQALQRSNTTDLSQMSGIGTTDMDYGGMR